MTLLPVVARELRVASRRPWTYRSRVAAGGVAFVITAWLLLVQSRMGFGKTGEPLFFALAAVGMGFALLAGILYSADSVSSEKREGTLGLLFLTDLQGLDVTLGKLAASSLGAVYGLVAVLPLLALALLLGGVTSADYWRMVATLLVTLFCSLAVGLLASVLTVDLRRSVLLAFLFVLVVAFGGPVLKSSVVWALGRLDMLPQYRLLVDASWLDSTTPFGGFGFAHNQGYRTEPGRYWTAIGFTAAVGLLALAYASWRLPYAWQEKTDVSRRGLRGWAERLRFSGQAARDQFRGNLLNQNPVAWLAGRHWDRPWLVWGFLVGVAAIVCLLGWSENSDWWDTEVGFGVSLLVHVTLKYWVANEAPRQFLDDRRNGAMELLLSTPLTTDEILRGRWLALYRQFLGPVVAVLAVDLFWLWWGTVTKSDPDNRTLVAVWLVWMAILVLDLWALSWAGLWTGMTSRGRATTAGLVGRVLVLPWLVWGLGVTFYGLGRAPGATTGGDEALWLFVGSWFGLGVFNDLLWVHHAKTSFRSSFREAATFRPGSGRRWWQPKPAAGPASADAG